MTPPSSPTRLTLGQLCKEVGLARSSVLHYETIGLLSPLGRSPAGYRFYGAAEIERLQTIRRLREAGLALADIRMLLDRHGSVPGQAADPSALLEKRLLELCREAERIRTQQHGLARLLALTDFRHRGIAGKAGWVALLRGAGFDEAAMRAWHAEFERDDPSGHEAFLVSLGLAAADVEDIRRRARAPAPAVAASEQNPVHHERLKGPPGVVPTDKGQGG